MAEGFAQRTSAVKALRAILADYTFSFGIFQEILQNSEDAGAKEQIFVLDNRCHDTKSLYHEKLAETQGPALLAFNDAYFDDDDWHALQNSYESSKASDSSKIGKFGVGFRSVFHLTDCPQIVSGDLFAFFDPLKAFSDSEGTKIDIAQVLNESPGQLSSFKYFMDQGLFEGAKLKGTIVRCPLRTRKGSAISNEVVRPEKLLKMLKDFVQNGLELSLLFLQNLKKITIIEVDERGNATTLASLDLTLSSAQVISEHSQFRSATTTLSSSIGTTSTKSWNLITCPFSGEEARGILAQCLDNDDNLEMVMEDHKLHSRISIAALSDLTKTRGRFFTYLPLPIFSSFGIHINANFSLTRSRQTLVNSQDFGVVRNSSDHILREWNKTLFDDLIPRAWKEYLQYLVTNRLDISSESLFDSWPTPATQDWAKVPFYVFENVVASESAVWPLLGKADAQVVFKPLDEILVAKRTEKKIAEALSTMGLEITCPPAYIFEFVQQSAHSNSFRVLSPERAHAGLLNHVQKFQSTPMDTIRVILEYLLSTSNCLNLVGLPVIPTSSLSGPRLALQRFNATEEVHTLLDQVQGRIFGACDDNSISTLSLPLRAGSILLEKGPGAVNVARLTNKQVVQYLKKRLENRNIPNITSTPPDRDTLAWFSAFWEWVGTWGERSTLLQLLKDSELAVVPCTHGLQPLVQPIFKAKGMQSLPVRQLSSFGISFAHVELSARAHDQLTSMDLLRPMTDVHALLDAMPSAENIMQPAPEECNGVLRHISAYIPGSCNKNGDLSPAQLSKLKSLPIFPVLTEIMGGAGTVARTFSSIPAGASARPVRRPPFLPSISDVLFVEADSMPSLLTYITPTPDRLDDNAILALSVDHFVDQTCEFQAYVLEYVTKKQGTIPPQVREKLGDKAFVTSQAGTLINPRDTIDPESIIAPLFAEPTVRPRLETEPQRSIISSLRKLKFLKSTVTPDLIIDRVMHIDQCHTSQDGSDLARNFLDVLCSMDYIELSQHNMPPEILLYPWLPTTTGELKSPKDTRDDSKDTPRRLFDKVLSVLDPMFRPRPWLRHYFGWDEPLPSESLVMQLRLVLNSTGADIDILNTVSDILEELSYTVTDDPLVMNSLRRTLEHQLWVPTTSGTLASIYEAAFDVPFPGSGFAQISVRPNAKPLLLALGCMDTPTTASILMKLNTLQDSPPSLEVVKCAVGLLTCLPEVMEPHQLDDVCVPDTDMILQSLSDIRFNNVGDSASFFPDHGPLTHSLIPDTIAQKLGLEYLGLQGADLIPDIKMGADPLDQVKDVLKDYTEGQFLTEFVANAVDAGATSFSVSISEGTPAVIGQVDDKRVISPLSMRGLAEAPTLVIYNNAVFTEADFKGICETSVGGKRGQTSTIGQFGRGSATMFHLTEMALVVSGRFALFLNPSGEYLPGRKTALRLPLHRVKVCFPDHFSAANGMYGFDVTSNDEEYPATLFILPLRTVTQLDSHPPERFAQTKTWDREMIINNVIKPFAASAPECLLFTKLSSISAIGLWEYNAVHADSEMEEYSGYLTHDVRISEGNSYNSSSWRVVSKAVSRNEIPPNARVSNDIRDPVVGLAACLPSDHPITGKHKLFSTLPLQITTSLPVHVTASFILSSDRRNIRLDEYDNKETTFNRWLLKDLLPPLYLFLLEKFALDSNILGDHLKRLWPGSKGGSDSISKHLIKSFYEDHVSASPRRIFIGKFDSSTLSDQRQPLLASEVVLTKSEPSTVRRVLARLRPTRLVELPGAAHDYAVDVAKLASVGPVFLKEEICERQDFCRFFSLVQTVEDPLDAEDPQLNIDDLEAIITYLAKYGPDDHDESLLIGMAILPLSDDTYGTFASASSSMVYYSMPQLQDSRYRIPHKFSPSRFIHPALTRKEMLKLKLNIITPTAEHLSTLIAEKIPAQPVLEDIEPELVDWILGNPDEGEGFWDHFAGYSQLGLGPEDIRDFPLVPTTRSVFVSLAECQEGAALVLQMSDLDPNGLLLRAFGQLDLNIVLSDSPPMHPNLRDVLEKPGYITMSRLEKVIKGFANKSPEHIMAEFNVVDDEARNMFSTWMHEIIKRSFAFSGLPDGSPLLRIARRLPIWPSASQEDPEIKLYPANDIHMLPPNISLAVAVPYINTRISDHLDLHCLRGPRYQYADIPNALNLPERIEDEDLGRYHNFMATWLYNLPRSEEIIRVPVPNTTGHIRNSDTLYARSELFLAAFGDNADDFVSPVFIDLQNKLCSNGLKTEDELDMGMFHQILARIDSDEDNNDRVDRAARIFRVFCNRMSVLALQNDTPDALHQFDDYRFIPRSTDRFRRLPGMGVESGLEVVHIPSDNGLEPVLRPIDLVREEFEAVAWSQRARFAEQPDARRILLVYPSLGKPLLSEVVCHLEYLASLTPRNADDRRIIMHDAKASYLFLTKHMPLTDEILSDDDDQLPTDITERVIFLNVDENALDPDSSSSESEDATEGWTWRKGLDLAFNVSDGSGFYSVKSFLKDSEALLRRAGALLISRPSIERSVVAVPEGRLKEFKDAFDTFRKEQRFVDVVFKARRYTGDGDSQEGGEVMEFWAHRSFLSICGWYFNDMFVGANMTESRNDASAASPVVLPTPTAGEEQYYDPCVEHILDYLYSSKPILPESLTLETLLQMLELSGQWELEELTKIIQEEIVYRGMIGPESYGDIKAIAEGLNAELLLEKCRDFMESEDNQRYLQRSLGQCTNILT